MLMNFTCKHIVDESPPLFGSLPEVPISAVNLNNLMVYGEDKTRSHVFLNEFFKNISIKIQPVRSTSRNPRKKQTYHGVRRYLTGTCLTPRESHKKKMLLGVTIVFLTLVSRVRSADSPCVSATPGMPGIPGIPGKDGRDGQKGAKGEPGIPASELGVKILKGEKGVKGSVGPKGKRGPMGPPGPQGDKGLVGQQGESGMPGNHKRQHQSAFTVARKTAQAPNKNNPVIFNIEITNDHKDYDVTTGLFTCRTPGLYYFVYHASQSYNLCVSLLVDGETKASFCDHLSNTHQVTSGGILVQLLKGQQVWLAVNDYNGMIGVEDNDSVFSGFLVSPD